MTRRERVLTALNHKQPDRVPIDFGSTAVTGMHVTCVQALRQHYGLESRPVKVFEPYQMLGWLDDDLLDAMGVDIVGVYGRNTIFGFANENWQPFRLPWGQEVLVSEHFRTTETAQGDLLIYPQGDTSAPPSGRMPSGGFFFDTIVRQEPIDDDNLDPTDNLEEFSPISREDIDHLVKTANALSGTDRARVLNFAGAGIGDIAFVPAPFLTHPKGIRDVAEWYMSLVTRQDYIHEVFTRQTDIALANLAQVHEALGTEIDVIFTCGTDFGTQNSTFCSVDTFNGLYAPYYRKINNWIHDHTAWKVFKHSCGAVESFMSDFTKVGFDIVNPVQCSAAGMEPAHLKARYGNNITFWGGGVDTQKTLPFGTPQEVREQVLRRCDILSKNGGFVFNAIHNVQANTPIENIVAMLEAVREFNADA